MQNRVKVSVDGKSFTLVGDEPEEHMRDVAVYIDEKMREVRQKAVAVTLDASLAYILTSINVADDYLKEKNKVAELEKQVLELTARLEDMAEERRQQAEAMMQENIEAEEETAEQPVDVELSQLHPMAMKGAERKPPVHRNNKKKKRRR